MRCRCWKTINGAFEKHVVRRSQLSEVFLAGGPSYTPVQQGLHLLGL